MLLIRLVARSGFGGCFLQAFSEKLGFFAHIFGKSGPFLCAFFEKVEFFACSLHVEGMFPGKILKKMIENYALRDVIIFHSKLRLTKYAQNCGPFQTLWTKTVDILDTLGPWEGAFAPLWLRAC